MVLVTAAGQVTGDGVLSANGGDGHFPNGGGGGGGEVKLLASSSMFSGALTARGGDGLVAGGAGTTSSHLQSSSWSRRFTHDNGGRQGANTLFGNYGSSRLEWLRIFGGAICVGRDLSLDSIEMLVGSNSWVMAASSRGGGGDWQVWTNLTIEAGGGLSVDGGSRSYWTGVPMPDGSYDSVAGSGGGGGHGGFGGRGASGVAAAGGDAHGNPLVFLPVLGR